LVLRVWQHGEEDASAGVVDNLLHSGGVGGGMCRCPGQGANRFPRTTLHNWCSVRAVVVVLTMLLACSPFRRKAFTRWVRAMLRG